MKPYKKFKTRKFKPKQKNVFWNLNSMEIKGFTTYYLPIQI